MALKHESEYKSPGVIVMCQYTWGTRQLAGGMMQEAECRRQEAGGLFFSLSVSVKTNLLLCSPGLLSLYIRWGWWEEGPLWPLWPSSCWWRPRTRSWWPPTTARPPSCCWWWRPPAWSWRPSACYCWNNKELETRYSRPHWLPGEDGGKYKTSCTKSKLHQGQILCLTLRQPARREARSRPFDLFTLFFIVAKWNYPGYIVRL